MVYCECQIKITQVKLHSAWPFVDTGRNKGSECLGKEKGSEGGREERSKEGREVGEEEGRKKAERGKENGECRSTTITG